MMENPARSATAEKDAVCGMTVDSASAKYRFDHNGKAYYFCCAGCLEKFRADPNRFLSADSGTGSHSGMQAQIVSIAPMSASASRNLPGMPSTAPVVVKLHPSSGAAAPEKKTAY